MKLQLHNIEEGSRLQAAADNFEEAREEGEVEMVTGTPRQNTTNAPIVDLRSDLETVLMLR